jgi:hypothetical protein
MIVAMISDLPLDVLRSSMSAIPASQMPLTRSLTIPVPNHVGEVLTLAVNCSTAWLTAADLMDSNMSKSWCAPGSSA